jgi:hypothetical protein
MRIQMSPETVPRLRPDHEQVKNVLLISPGIGKAKRQAA